MTARKPPTEQPQPRPAMTNAAGVVLLGMIVLAAIIGAVVLAAIGTTIPDLVGGLGLGSLTALTTLLRPLASATRDS